MATTPNVPTPTDPRLLIELKGIAVSIQSVTVAVEKLTAMVQQILQKVH
jgi:hypothetical protein